MSAGKAVSITVIILFLCLFLCCNPLMRSKAASNRRKNCCCPVKTPVGFAGRPRCPANRIHFSFNAQKINPGLLILLTGRSITVQALLQQLKSRYKLRHRVAGNYIIIHNEPLTTKELPLAPTPPPNAATPATVKRIPPLIRPDINPLQPQSRQPPVIQDPGQIAAPRNHLWQLLLLLLLLHLAPGTNNLPND